MARDYDAVMVSEGLLPREDIELQTHQILPTNGVQLPPHYDDVSRDDDSTPTLGQFIA